MAIELVTKFLPYVDEKFATESKTSIMTNQDFDFAGANIVKVYKISTAEMNDYMRHPPVVPGGVGAYGSRYGEAKDLDATTESFMLTKDRSFTFVIDKLDEDETGQQLEGAKALERQLREVVIPEVDTHAYSVMCENAGTVPDTVELTPDNIYDEITKASEVLDDSEVPETERVLVVTPNTYRIMKKCKEIILNTDIGEDMRIKGVIANLDGATVVKVPAKRLPNGFGFMLIHPSATVAPTKLADYKIHRDPPGISGSLVEGRVNYDAFVLENKAKAIYYQAQPAAETETEAGGDQNEETTE